MIRCMTAPLAAVASDAVSPTLYTSAGVRICTFRIDFSLRLCIVIPMFAECNQLKTSRPPRSTAFHASLETMTEPSNLACSEVGKRITQEEISSSTNPLSKGLTPPAQDVYRTPTIEDFFLYARQNEDAHHRGRRPYDSSNNSPCQHCLEHRNSIRVTLLPRHLCQGRWDGGTDDGILLGLSSA